MILIFCNCRDIGQAPTVCILRELSNSHVPAVLFLSEVNLSCKNKMNNVVKSLGFDNCYLLPSIGASSGLVLIWKKSIDIHIISSSVNYITALILNDSISLPWYLTGVYGPKNPIYKPNFWDNLTRTGKSFDGPWCIAGDFNVLLEQKDKIEGKPFSSSSVFLFYRLVEDTGLLDFRFTCYPFTWNNHRAGKAKAFLQ